MAAAADARSFWHLFKIKIENVYTTKKQRLIRNQMLFFEADSRTRTDDLRITNASLYQLSHIGMFNSTRIVYIVLRKKARGF